MSGQQGVRGEPADDLKLRENCKHQKSWPSVAFKKEATHEEHPT